MLTEEGGTAVLQGYRPQFYFRTTAAGVATRWTEMVMPGDNVKMVVE